MATVTRDEVIAYVCAVGKTFGFDTAWIAPETAAREVSVFFASERPGKDPSTRACKVGSTCRDTMRCWSIVCGYVQGSDEVLAARYEKKPLR